VDYPDRYGIESTHAVHYLDGNHARLFLDYVVEHDMMTEEAARKQFNLKNYIIQATIGALIMGVVTSAIVAIFTRKREKPS
jgi:hypothetical protein